MVRRIPRIYSSQRVLFEPRSRAKFACTPACTLLHSLSRFLHIASSSLMRSHSRVKESFKNKIATRKYLSRNLCNKRLILKRQIRRKCHALLWKSFCFHFSLELLKKFDYTSNSFVLTIPRFRLPGYSSVSPEVTPLMVV